MQDHQYSAISWCIIIIVIFVPLITVFGVVSKFAFIFVVYRVEVMRTITNIFLVNLAIADSSLLVIAFAQYIGSYISHYYMIDQGRRQGKLLERHLGGPGAAAPGGGPGGEAPLPKSVPVCYDEVSML